MKMKLTLFGLIVVLSVVAFVKLSENPKVKTKERLISYDDVKDLFQLKPSQYAGFIEIEKISPNAILFYKLNENNSVSEIFWNICQPISQKQIEFLSSVPSLKRIHDVYLYHNQPLDFSKIYQSKNLSIVSYFSEDSELNLKAPFVRSNKWVKSLRVEQ